MKYYLSFFLLLFSLSLMAQKINVKEFSDLPQDLAARVHEKQDVNGNACALVKVIIPVQDVVFEGWIIDQKYTPGEYWVYLPENTPKMTIKHNSVAPFQYEFPEKLEGKHTYRLILEIQEEQQHVAFFNVKANVNDFILYIGQDKVKSKKGVIEAKLANGTYYYSLVAKNDKYETIEDSVTITDEDTYKYVNCKFVLSDEYLAEKQERKERRKEKRRKIWEAITSLADESNSGSHYNGYQNRSSSYDRSYRSNNYNVGNSSQSVANRSQSTVKSVPSSQSINNVRTNSNSTHSVVRSSSSAGTSYKTRPIGNIRTNSNTGRLIQGTAGRRISTRR